LWSKLTQFFLQEPSQPSNEGEGLFLKAGTLQDVLLEAAPTAHTPANMAMMMTTSK